MIDGGGTPIEYVHSRHLDSMKTKDIAADFMSNRSPAAMLRDIEQKIIEKGIMPVDLSCIAPALWKDHINYDVVLPPVIKRYLDGRPEEPFNDEERDRLEDAVTEFYHVAAPFYIAMDSRLAETGHTWNFDPRAAQFLTGFVLYRE